MNDGWIGVDLDGTLAVYNGWGDGKIGKPIPLMLKRVKNWVDEGQTVKIFTARASLSGRTQAELEEQLGEIRDWLENNGLPRNIEITCTKDFRMIELWDDRCVQVVPNTGISVEEYIKSQYVRDNRSNA